MAKRINTPALVANVNFPVGTKFKHVVRAAQENWATENREAINAARPEKAHLECIPLDLAKNQPTELELHRMDYTAIRNAGWECPGELLAAYKTLEAKYNQLTRAS